MANTDIKLGFQLYRADDEPLKFLVANGDTIKAGDTVYIDSSGYATATDGVTMGVAQSNIIDGYTNVINATAATASYDYVMVLTNPMNIYSAQITTGAQDSPYTTRSSAACYDEAGSSGAQYIDAAASTNDTWKVLGVAYELKDGAASALAAYEKVFCQTNPLVHFRGTIA